jgi:hypothetical protein
LKKGTKVILKDQVISDAYLPPVPIEGRFRFENTVFAKLEGQNKFKKMFEYDLFLRVKK